MLKLVKKISCDFWGKFFPFGVDKCKNTAIVQGSHLGLMPRKTFG